MRRSIFVKTDISTLVLISHLVFDLPVLLLLALEADLDVFVPPEPVPPLLLDPDPPLEPPLLPTLPVLPPLLEPLDDLLPDDLLPPDFAPLAEDLLPVVDLLVEGDDLEVEGDDLEVEGDDLLVEGDDFFCACALFTAACALPLSLIPNEPAGGLEGIPVALAAASPFACCLL